MPSTRLTRDFSSQTATNDKKCTISFWFKFTEILTGGSDRWLFGEYNGSQDHAYIYLRNDKSIGVYGRASNSSTFSFISNQKFLDNSAWYHCVVACDTTLGTSADRIKMYINGEQITSWATASYPSQNLVLRWNNDGAYHYIGGTPSYGTHFDGLMSHFHLCDGQQLAPTVFGETDSTTGEWSIITSPTFTPGTCGFSILKDGNSVSDVSSNSNDWTIQSGSLTNTEDCPDNNFATLNPLVNPNGATLSHGNTHGNKSGTHAIVTSTIPCGYPDAPSTAKFYWETKMEAADGRTVGLVKSNMPQNSTWHDDYLGQNSGGGGVIGYYLGTYVDGTQADVAYNGTAPQVTITGGWSTGDVLTHAYDASTGKYWQGKNGTWFTVGGYVGDPANGNYPLVTLNATDREHFIFPADSCYDGRWSFNFGNGYFKTNQISSEGTNASGVGKFEFNVPSGFTAISTKGYNK